MRYIVLIISDIDPFIRRISVLSRCVSAAVFLSHSLRNDVIFRIFMRRRNILVTLKARSLKNIRADEQSMSGIFKKIYKVAISECIKTKKVHYGIVFSKRNFAAAVKKPPGTFSLYESPFGKDIRKLKFPQKNNNILLVLSEDSQYTNSEIEYFISHSFVPVLISKSPIDVDAKIVLFNNEVDRWGI